MIVTALIGLAVVACFTALVWIVSVIKSDASIIDPMWGPAFLVLLVTYTLREGSSARTTLLIVLVGLWSVRLFLYLSWRRWGEPEDYRYRAMRKSAGGNFAIKSLVTVFSLQGLLAWIISAPLLATALATARHGGDLALLDYAGVVLWTVGFFFETVGDLQLARFKADPESAGKVMDRGLWRYTRHPNYFGDFTVWWGFYLIAAAGGGWWSVYGPLLMSVLLLRVSGVALLEKKLGSTRPGYQRYARRTNAFWPWFPKRMV